MLTYKLTQDEFNALQIAGNSTVVRTVEGSQVELTHWLFTQIDWDSLSTGGEAYPLPKIVGSNLMDSVRVTYV